MFGKKKKTDFQDEIRKAKELVSQMRFQSSDGKKTLSIESIEKFLREYRALSAIITDKKENPPNDLVKMMEDFEGLIYYQYFRVFSINENTSIRAESPGEIQKAINDVENEFLKNIAKAQKYFGSFLEGEFHYGKKVSVMNKPNSVKEMIEKLKFEKEDWTKYVILESRPQPLYRELYNMMLKKCIKSWIKSA